MSNKLLSCIFRCLILTSTESLNQNITIKLHSSFIILPTLIFLNTLFNLNFSQLLILSILKYSIMRMLLNFFRCNMIIHILLNNTHNNFFNPLNIPTVHINSTYNTFKYISKHFILIFRHLMNSSILILSNSFSLHLKFINSLLISRIFS